MNTHALKKVDSPVCLNVPAGTLYALTPQARALFEHLNVHRNITQREAMIDLGVQSLTKRISELRKYFVIVSDIRVHKTTKQRYCRYFLKGHKPEKQVAAEVKQPMPEIDGGSMHWSQHPAGARSL